MLQGIGERLHEGLAGQRGAAYGVDAATLGLDGFLLEVGHGLLVDAGARRIVVRVLEELYIADFAACDRYPHLDVAVIGAIHGAGVAAIFVRSARGVHIAAHTAVTAH